MNLKFKKPSRQAQKIMSKTALKPFTGRGLAPEVQRAEEAIKSTTGHQHVKIVNSGNSAIMAVMNALPGPFILPDQGAWTGFKKIAEFLNRETIFIPTEKGISYPDLLEEYLNRLSLTYSKQGSALMPSTLFITSFAGYTAEQPVKELYEVCMQHDIILVEDASGSVGDPENRLCNGQHAHVILASTGSPKIVNVGNGGFISTNNKEILDKSKFLLNMMRADPITCAGIASEIKKAPSNLNQTIEACTFLKKKLINVYHKEKRGINVIVSSSDPKNQARALRQEISAEGKNIITTCPLYNRILEKAICIEIKNVEPSCLSQDSLQEIKDYIKNIVF